MASRHPMTAKEGPRRFDTQIDWTKVDLEDFVVASRSSSNTAPRIRRLTSRTTTSPHWKIAWAHLKEFRDYYTRLDKLEAEASAYWHRVVDLSI